jgi:uncharacterized protein
MSQYDPVSSRPTLNYEAAESRSSAETAALVSFFNSVYAWMATGLAVTALVGWTVSRTPALVEIIYSSPGMMLFMVLGAFGIAWLVQSAAATISATAGTILFLVYAAVIGLIISGIFIIYDIQMLAAAFVMTAGVFGALSVYGFVTKRDLSGIGGILAMAFIGLFIGSLVNLFIANEAFSWFITYGVLIVFIGLTAYHTQNLRNLALEAMGNQDLSARYAIIGSLVLYVAFINLFLAILRILGSRR